MVIINYGFDKDGDLVAKYGDHYYAFNTKYITALDYYADYIVKGTLMDISEKGIKEFGIEDIEDWLAYEVKQ